MRHTTNTCGSEVGYTWFCLMIVHISVCLQSSMFMHYNIVISVGGRVSLLSRKDIMFFTCMAMTRHSSRPCGQRHILNTLHCTPLEML